MQTKAGTWQVTLDVKARDWVEVGVFANAEKGEESGYAQMHRIRSGKQTITVTVPRQPTRAGVDPNNRLIDLKTDDNMKRVRVTK